MHRGDGPAERARIKFAREQGGNSRGSAPTHPLYMPRGHTTSARWSRCARPNQTHRGGEWELTSIPCSHASIVHAEGPCHVSTLAPLSAVSIQTHRGIEWELTVICSHTSIQHAEGEMSRQQFGPAERAQTKRMAGVLRQQDKSCAARGSTWAKGTHVSTLLSRSHTNCHEANPPRQ